MGPGVPKACAMKCVICKIGELHDGHTNVVHARGTHVVVIENVPAQICDTCGEYYLDENAAQTVYDQAEKALASGHPYEVLKFAA